MALRALQSVILGIAVVAFAIFFVPGALHTIVCEHLPFGPCPQSPYPVIESFLVDHRRAWLFGALVYAVCAIAAFYRQLPDVLLGIRTGLKIRIAIAVVTIVVLGVMGLVRWEVQ